MAFTEASVNASSLGFVLAFSNSSLLHQDQTTRCDKREDLRQLSGIEKGPVFGALIDHNSRKTGVVLSMHALTALGAIFVFDASGLREHVALDVFQLDFAWASRSLEPIVFSFNENIENAMRHKRTSAAWANRNRRWSALIAQVPAIHVVVAATGTLVGR